jgi:hypothetical protein
VIIRLTIFIHQLDIVGNSFQKKVTVRLKVVSYTAAVEDRRSWEV